MTETTEPQPAAASSAPSLSPLTLSDRIRRAFWRGIPKLLLSKLLGMMWRIPVARFLRKPVLSLFSKIFSIDMSEAEKTLRDYRSVHDLFIRRLKPGARAVPAEDDLICCPADGHLVEIGQVTEGTVMNVKGMGFSLAELLASREAAQALEGGSYVIVYLSPADYHRVHVPVTGHIVGWQHVPGRLFSVSEVHLRREPGLFARNERVVIDLDADKLGPCACVMVAAFGVGNITLSCDAEVETHGKGFAKAAVRTKRFSSPPRVQKGDELGIFHLGSTVIAVFAPGRVELSPLLPGAQVRVGQVIGQITRGLPESSSP